MTTSEQARADAMADAEVRRNARLVRIWIKKGNAEEAAYHARAAMRAVCGCAFMRIDSGNESRFCLRNALRAVPGLRSAE
jgi:hypothetical protein